jgi:TonB family protein
MSIELDLGGSEFEYLEHIFVRINITNNDSVPKKIHKSYATYGPEIGFILKNGNEELFDYTADCSEWKTPEYETFYILDPKENRGFPLRGGYYFLTDYYRRDQKESFPYLPADDYTLKARIKLGQKVYYSEEVVFHVTQPRDLQAMELLRELNKNFLDDNNFYETLNLYNELYENHRNSIYNILAIPKIDFMLGHNRSVAFEERNKKRAELKKRTISYLKNNFQNNRQALAETKWLMIGIPQERKQEFIEKACSEIKNDEFIESFKGLINKEMPLDLKIEKVKNPPPPPPVEDEVFEPFAVSEKPVLLHKENPKYPLAAKDIALEGRVTVMVTISENGDILHAKIIESTPLLDEAALQAAAKCKFKPAKHRNRFVKVRMPISFDFRLNN